MNNMIFTGKEFGLYSITILFVILFLLSGCVFFNSKPQFRDTNINGFLDVNGDVNAFCYYFSDGNKMCGFFDLNQMIITLNPLDTNWQTSYPLFDANMALRYVKQTDGNVWYSKTSDINGTYQLKADMNSQYVRQTDGNVWYSKVSDVNGLYWKQIDLNRWIDQNLQVPTTPTFKGITTTDTNNANFSYPTIGVSHSYTFDWIENPSSYSFVKRRNYATEAETLQAPPTSGNEILSASYVAIADPSTNNYATISWIAFGSKYWFGFLYKFQTNESVNAATDYNIVVSGNCTGGWKLKVWNNTTRVWDLLAQDTTAAQTTLFGDINGLSNYRGVDGNIWILTQNALGQMGDSMNITYVKLDAKANKEFQQGAHYGDLNMYGTLTMAPPYIFGSPSNRIPAYLEKVNIGDAGKTTVFPAGYASSINTANGAQYITQDGNGKIGIVIDQTPTSTALTKGIELFQRTTGADTVYQGIKMTLGSDASYAGSDPFGAMVVASHLTADFGGFVVQTMARKAGVTTKDAAAYSIGLIPSTGTGTTWGYWNNLANANNQFGLDDVYTYFGSARDASIRYDGNLNNFRINPKEVGAGKLQVDGNTIIIGDMNVTERLTVGSGAAMLNGMASGDTNIANNLYVQKDINANKGTITGNVLKATNFVTIGAGKDMNTGLVAGDLNIAGNFYQDKNFFGNNIYGEDWNKHDSGFVVVDLATPDVYVAVSKLYAGTLNGFAVLADGNMVAQASGVYSARINMSAEGGAGGEHGYKLFVNETGQNQCYTHEGSSGDAKSIGFYCFVRLAIGDKITVRIDDHANPVNDITLYSFNLNLNRIGN